MRRLLPFIILLSAHVLASHAQGRQVLVEYATATWCQYCPAGAVSARELERDFPGQVITVALHLGDAMQIDDTSYIMQTGISGLPGANIDRSFLSQSTGTWSNHIANQLALPAAASVGVSLDFDPLSRSLQAVVGTEFLGTLSPGDYRLCVMVVEDMVTGPEPHFSQRNFYAGGNAGPMGGFQNLPDPVPARLMVYDHVARMALTPYSGEPGNLPSSPMAGQLSADTFSLTLPPAWDEEYIRVCAYLLEAGSGQVLNSGRSHYIDGSPDARPAFHSDTVLYAQLGVPFQFDILCHDPDNDSLSITAPNGLPSWMSLQAQGSDDGLLVGTANTVGLFPVVLEVSDGHSSRSRQFRIEVISTDGEWQQLGIPGFSAVESEYVSAGAYDPSNDKAYAMGISESGFVYTYVLTGNSWSALGNASQAGSSRYGDIAVHPFSHNPWMAYRQSEQTARVKRFINGAWEQVGGDVPLSAYLRLRFAADGTAYLAGVTSPYTYVYHFDGSSWVLTGGALPGAACPLTWPDLQIGEQNQPYVLAARLCGQSAHSSVYKYASGSWNELPGPVNPVHATSDHSSSLQQLAIGQNGEVYAAIAHDFGTNVYRFDSWGWDTLAGNIDHGEGKSFDLLTGSDGHLYMAYRSCDAKVTCRFFNGVAWGSAGMPGFTPEVADLSIFSGRNGYPGILYIDMQNGNRLSAKQYVVPGSGLETDDGMGRSFSLFPNPSDGYLVIDQSIAPNSRFEITDLGGCTVKSGAMAEDRILVDDLEPGLYLIRFNGAGTAYKFLKQ